MVNHPQRSTWRSSLPIPSPAEIRDVIENKARITQGSAADLANASKRTIEDWLSGARRPDSARWELLLLRIGEHPTHLLIDRIDRRGDPRDA